MKRAATGTRAPAPPRFEERSILLHGHQVSYRQAGSGPEVLLLIHGVAGRSRQWAPAAELLASRFTVIAPDLLGHGASAKPRGDYSLGAYAVMVRDLLLALGYRRATVVGHSLGGGIAMQFSYLFPVFCERLVLVSSGGLGREVHALLRAATLPGSELVLPFIAHPRLLPLGGAVTRLLELMQLEANADLGEMASAYASLAEPDARQAFLHTLRAVIDPGGQRVSATDRLYLAADIPSLILWGGHDRLIPVEHGYSAHARMPGSRLEVFERSGHFPQLDDPIRFAGALTDFIDSTAPAHLGFSDADLDLLERRLREGAPARSQSRRGTPGRRPRPARPGRSPAPSRSAPAQASS